MEKIDEFGAEAVVVDAGTFPTNERALRWLEVCEKIVCCDGAANEFVASGRIPWRIVGDCDSLSQEMKDKYEDIVRRIPDQETNDQTKAVMYLASKGINKIAILSATGRREDHTLGNISLLTDYLRLGIEARIYTDYGVFIPINGDCRFECPIGTQVSIFNFGATGIHAKGLRYPLRDFTSWWQGTLNETTAPFFSIHAVGTYLLFLNY